MFLQRVGLTLAMIDAAFTSLCERNFINVKKKNSREKLLKQKLFAEKCLKSFKSSSTTSVINFIGKRFRFPSTSFVLCSISGFSTFCRRARFFTSPHLCMIARNGRNHLRFYDLIDIKSREHHKKQRNYQFLGETGANDNNSCQTQWCVITISRTWQTNNVFLRTSSKRFDVFSNQD